MQGRYGQMSFYFAAINHQFKTDSGIGERLERLTQLLPFELFSKKFCLNISELGLEIV